MTSLEAEPLKLTKTMQELSRVPKNRQDLVILIMYSSHLQLHQAVVAEWLRRRT